MKIKSQKDFWTGLLFIVAGIAFAIGALNYPLGDAARPGPGALPLGLGMLLALLGALLLFKALTIEVEGGDPLGAIASAPLLLVVGSVALFALLLPRAGLAVALPVLVLLAGMAAPGWRWRDLLLQALVLTLAGWLVLGLGLKLDLPWWPA